MERELTLLEKVKLLGYQPFIDVLEIDAMEESKLIIDGKEVDPKVLFLANKILTAGQLANKLTFAKTWLVYLDVAVPVNEKQDDGLQLQETILLLIQSEKLRDITIKVISKLSEQITQEQIDAGK